MTLQFSLSRDSRCVFTMVPLKWMVGPCFFMQRWRLSDHGQLTFSVVLVPVVCCKTGFSQCSRHRCKRSICMKDKNKLSSDQMCNDLIIRIPTYNEYRCQYKCHNVYSSAAKDLQYWNVTNISSLHWNITKEKVHKNSNLTCLSYHPALAFMFPTLDTSNKVKQHKQIQQFTK